MIFATSNPNKVSEIRRILGERIEVQSLAEIGWTDPIPETQDSIAGNAIQKATTLSDALEVDCIAEDTGLEVRALDGRPGVHSAHYAGEQRDAGANMSKLLEELGDCEDRSARFRTVIATVLDGAIYLFEGIVEGRIADSPQGNGGFGYDPIFIPEGHEESFGELSPEIKAGISHRARASDKFARFMATYVKRKSPG